MASKTSENELAHHMMSGNGSGDGDVFDLIQPGKPNGPIFVDPETFLSAVEHRLSVNPQRGTLAYIEIIEHASDSPSGIFSTEDDLAQFACPEIIGHITQIIGVEGMFCWHGDRYIVLLYRPSTLIARRILSKISFAIAVQDQSAQRAVPHLTPALGYVDFRMAASSRDLWLKAEAALDEAKSSLEIEPTRYSGSKKEPAVATSLPKPINFWQRAPQWLILSVQLLISLVLGLGAPFILYAVCDALGFDISGTVYIGVVIVLVATAIMIWIEGFLALRRTTPPLEPGSPYPLATVIIPAYLPNEAETIMETLQAFLRLEYANRIQVIIAYNCPAPHMPVEDEMATLAVSEAANGKFIIEPVRVHGSTSKAQNVNAVIGRVRGRFVGIFDADHHPRPDSLQRAWRWLSNGWDIVQGRCSVRNGADTWVSRMVAVEFEQIYAVSHPGRARLHGFGIFGGSNGFWRTSVLHETRMRRSMLTEDIDSSIRALTAGYKITGDRDLISEELGPTSLNQLLNQRLRWAQGWFQVSLRRIMPALLSRNVTFRQKLGLCHLLVWRELFPWYSIQVVPIMVYWVWVYGWSYIHWAVPIFLATTVFTFSAGPGMILLSYILAQDTVKRKPGWFVEYLFVSTFFYSPFKDALSRIAHVKEAMQERAWKVTSRAAPTAPRSLWLVKTSAVLLALMAISPSTGWAQPAATRSSRSASDIIATLLGGEAETIESARHAAENGRHADAARLFTKAIADVPRRRTELLPELADNLAYSGRSGEAVPLYSELLAGPMDGNRRRELTLQLAGAMSNSGQNNGALAIYDGLLSRNPQDADIGLRRARVLSWLGQTDAAVGALDKMPPAQWSNGALGKLGDQLLIDAAFQKSRAGQTAFAKRLFERAFAHNSRLRSTYEHDYIALGIHDTQLTAGAALSGDRAAIIRREITHTKSGSRPYVKLENELAVTLTATDRPQQALEAWNTYLRYAPGDTNAIVVRAKLLAGLDQPEKALASFRLAYARDPRNAAARAGVLAETVSQARSAARENSNGDARILFASATEMTAGRDHDLLREYADQLSFTGQAVSAIPLYIKVLGDPAVSPLNHRSALAGLANAYSWADRLTDALPIYTELSDAAPGDVELRWKKITCAARIAARADHNVESARLFADAVAIDPKLRMAVLPEYADQLSFVGRSTDAIALYQEALAQPGLAPDNALNIHLGLAQAYALAARYTDAESEYASLIKANPHKAILQWDLWVVSARDAAIHDRNKQSAELFARAIQSDPERSKGLLREYADQLSYTGRATYAPIFYKAALRQPRITEKDEVAISSAQAQALEWSGQYAAAATIYDALLKNAPADSSLQWHRLVLTAREEAQTDQNQQAARDFGAAIKLLPERRLDILKNYADQLTFSGKSDLAIPLYRGLLVNSRSQSDHRGNELALARALAWNHRFKDALNLYDRLISSQPTDLEPQLGAARTKSWMGRQGDARAAYQKILAVNADNGEAIRGLAQVEDWDGRHFTAQALLRRWLAQDPKDLAAHQLLAQSLVWSGRPDIAMKEVNLALVDRPPAPKTPPNAHRSANLPAAVPVSQNEKLLENN